MGQSVQESITPNNVDPLTYMRGSYPNSAGCVTFTDILCSLISQLSLKNTKLITCSDFNRDLLAIDNHVPTAEFIHRIYSLSLMPVISKPTRVTNRSATLIGNIFVGGTLEHRAGILFSYISNQFPIFIIKKNYFSTCNRNNAIEITYRAITEQTVLHFRQLLLASDLAGMTQREDIDDAFHLLYENVFDAYNIACPIVKKSMSMKRMRKPWITDDILSCIRLRSAYSVLWKSNRFPSEQYKEYRNYVTNKIRTSKKRYYSEKFQALKDNIKATWKLINSILRPNKIEDLKGIVKKIVYDNVEYTSEKNIVEIFNEHFVSVGQRVQESITPNNVDHLTYMRGSYPNSLYYSRVNEYVVQDVIKSLKNKPCGIYCIPVKVLKATSDILSLLLAALINRSFMWGYFPKWLKVVGITPIYKGGEHTDLGNYRPISILPTFSKIMEKVVYTQLNKYITRHNVLKKTLNTDFAADYQQLKL